MRKLILVLLFLLPKFLFAQFKEYAYPLKSAIWDNHRITVCWENPKANNSKERILVKKSIDSTWELHSTLEFEGWNKCKRRSKGIRIKIQDTRPHVKRLGNKLDGRKNGMVLNFTFKKWDKSSKFSANFRIKAISVHEFGHAIGFAHEQNRDDCTFDDCLEEENGEDGDWYITACDLNSIMNYCNPKWNNNGLLSDLDIEAVQKIYTESVSNEPLGIFTSNLELVYTSNKLKKEIGDHKNVTHEVKVYLTGNNSELNNVDKVIYKLNNRFNNQNLTSQDDNSKFGILLGLKDNLQIFATVIKSDGSKIEIQEYINIK